MPIKISKKHHTFKELTPSPVSGSSDIKRALRIGILNLMPQKVQYETQILTRLNKYEAVVEPLFITTSTYRPSNTPAEYLKEFYIESSELDEYRPDLMIISGAPVELMPFENVKYWKELQQVITWSEENCISVMYICWGAQAALYNRYGINKYTVPGKLSGIYKHICHKETDLTKGFNNSLYSPHSRYTTIKREDVEKCSDLIIEAESEEAGVYLITSTDIKRVYITGHPEYTRYTLKNEYFRDIQKNLNPTIPVNYFPSGNTALTPDYLWKEHGDHLFRNWLDYAIKMKGAEDAS